MNRFFVMAMACVMAFASCEDVPMPYGINDEMGEGAGNGGAAASTRENPTSVADAIAALSASNTGNYWVKGVIVGYIPTGGTTTNMSVAVFGAPAADATDASSNMVLAPAAGVTDGSKCMAIQLPGGAVRNALNLKDNPGNVGKEVILYGSLEKYCGATGLKNVSFCIIDGKEHGVDPSAPAQTVFDKISIAEFLSRKDTEKAYEITGVASNLNENYASFDLKEGDASIYIYKTVDASGKNISFAGLNIVAGDTVTVRGVYYPYTDKNGNVKDEINPATYVSHKKAQGGSGNGGTTSVDPKGTGTEADPFNVSAAIAKCTEAGTTATTEVYFVEGTVKSVDASGAASYGNLSLDLVDEGATTVFKAYRVLPLEGRFVTGNEVKVGDKVLVKGQLVNYNNKTPETSQGSGYVVKVNGSALELSPAIVAAASTNLEWDQTSVKIAVSVANAAEGATITAESLTAGATCAIEGGELVVTLPGQNTTEANIEYEFKLSCPGAADVTIKVVHKKKAAEGDQKSFDTTLTWTNGTNAYNDGKGTVNGTPDVVIYKLSTSSKAGNATITVPEGHSKIGFYAVGWKGSTETAITVGGKSVTVSGNDGATSNSPYTLTVTDSDYYEVEVTAGDVAISCDKRVLIFGINAK